MKFLCVTAIAAAATAFVPSGAFPKSTERSIADRSEDGLSISVQRPDTRSISALKTDRLATPSSEQFRPVAESVRDKGAIPVRGPAAREPARAFELSRPGAPTVRITFLSSTAFRITVPGLDEEPANLPEYMRVKSDADYPPVAVNIDKEGDGATFATSGARVQIVPGSDRLTVDVRTPDKVLIENWEIDPGRRSASIELRADEHVFGFGDKRAALDQRGQKVEMLNRDAFASENNESYKSIPFYMSSAGYGLFFHNFYRSMFDIGAAKQDRLQLSATAGSMDFYVFIGGPKELLGQYTELTGRPAMLPRWAFGYHQAKASYQGRDAFRVAAEMRRRKLPVDVIYYDDWDDDAIDKSFIDSLWRQYRVRLTHGFGMPMFGTYHGSDDAELLDDLASGGFLMVGENGHAVIGPDDHVESGDEPTAVAYLDFFSPRAVDHVFATKWSDAIDNGAILGMVDFGELDRITDADHKFWPSLGMSVAQTRNLYGLVYPQSVIDGVLQRAGGRITGMVRPGFAGTQRLGWSTTGDSLPTYRNFRAHTRALLNLTLSGFSNVGQDIGGWDRKGSHSLYARWFAAATFYPFMWSHGQGDHEPYAHGETVERAAREFLNLRYRLVPYLYSLHESAHRTGVPVLRPLPLQESTDRAGHRVDDEFFVGEDLLVAPLFNDQGDRRLYLPNGLWYDFFDELPPTRGSREIERRSVPLDRLPVYVRAGAVIPLGPPMQYTGEKPVDPLSVQVYGFAPEELADGERMSEFSLYEDDGISTAYQNGEFQRTHLRFRQSRDAARFAMKAESGDGYYWSLPERAYRLQFHGLPAGVKTVQLDGKDIPQAGAPESGGSASWSIDAAGNVLVSIPRTSNHALSVELIAGARSACAGSC